MGLTKHPDLPDVPNAYDLVTDDADRQLFKLIFGPWAFGRPIFAPPGTPADRVATLRNAFKETIADPDFIAEAEKINLEINTTSGENIAGILDGILKTPEPVVIRARQLLGVDKRQPNSATLTQLANKDWRETA